MSYDDDLPAPPPAIRLRWDVFLSFIGDDFRDNFIDRLYASFQKDGVRVFRKEDGLTRPDILEAIEDSAASIVIITPNYASSGLYLEELAKICRCGRLILPVFYGVDPSDVRRQKGPFEVSFRNLEEKFGDEKVDQWRKAMERAGGIAGWVFNGSEEPQLIRSLVKKILSELKNTPLNVATYFVGLDSRIEQVMSFLDVKSNGVQVLGFYGMGGIGKTTLAKALYNKLVGNFDCRSFLSNIRETFARENGLISLQKKLIGDLSEVKDVPPINTIKAGVAAIKKIVREKRVLVVLDDVDDISQLDSLAIRKEWFYEGSRIMITTRNEEVLLSQGVDKINEVKELDRFQALELFSYHAFRRESPPESFLNLSKQIVSLTGGLPLALEVFGSFLFDKRRLDEWEDVLQKLKQIRPRDLQDVLKISFDGLDEQQRCIFLDIACLFLQMNMKREDAIDIFKGCGFRAETAVRILTAKSLIKITEDTTIWMHDQLRDMGRQIVQQENPHDAGMQSRLWNRDQIMSVLKRKKGTEFVRGLALDFENNFFWKNQAGDVSSWNNFKMRPSFTSAVTYLLEKSKKYILHGLEEEKKLILRAESFEPMINLRLLQINHANLEGKFNLFPAKLKWLQWKECPLETLPRDFFPQELAVLDISGSRIKQVWDWGWWAWYNNKVAEKLLVLNLRGCYNLTALPDLSSHRAVEKIILERCSALSEIHKSIGNASTLRHLDLRDCSNLVDFPSHVSGLKHLEILVVSGCLKLKILPDDLGNMTSLRELLADKTAIGKVPESIFHLTKLERLSLNDCQSLKRLPLCIGRLSSLRELSLNDSALEEVPDSVGYLGSLEKFSLIRCSSLTEIPDSIGNLKMLTDFSLSGSSIRELPTSIGSLLYLKDLSIGNCRFLSKLPVSIGGLDSIIDLQLDGASITELPCQIGALKALKRLQMRNCRSLGSLPESVGNMSSLTKLTVVNAVITELPESIGMLENLIILRLNSCEKLCKLPASIGKLKSLHHLLMEKTAVTELPESFGMLSNLMILKMAKKPYPELLHSAPKELENLGAQEKQRPVVLPTSFANLSLLTELDARAWKICGRIPDDFEKLLSLEILNLGHNDFCSLPSSLVGLSNLRKLLVPHCKKLTSLPPLPSSLQELNAANCPALDSLSDLSNLENLQELHLSNCEKVVDVPGLECMKSLIRLHMSGCNASSSTLMRRLDKAALKKLHELSIPGSEIPDWFTPEIVTFSARKHCVIKGVLIAVVVSVNHEIPDDLRDQLPSIVDIQAKILKLDQHRFASNLSLMGVPRTSEDQLYLYRFPHYHPLVSKLKDGYTIRVAKQNPPFTKGIELKKSGIHLVFEDNDDYGEDEDFLDDSQQSVSEKLTKFLHSVGGVSRTSDFKHEVERKLKAAEGSEEKSLKQKNYFIFFFVIVSFFCLLFSWLWLH